MSAGFSAGAPDLRRVIWLIVWSLVLSVTTLVLDTRHNEFPYFYHPDEPAKVEQVMTSAWNYHHPMLLLSATKTAVELFHVPPHEQDIAQAGRWISAAFTSVAIVAFSLLAYAWRGWTVSIATGLGLLLHHQLYELAHYMKEDAALLMGLALTFLTAYAYWYKPNAWRALLLGVAVALAISGKYVGIVALGIALPVLARAPLEGRREWHWMTFITALAATLLLVDLPLLLHWNAFRQSLHREMEFVVHGQRGITRSVPHFQYWNSFRDNSTPVIWGLLLVFLAARWRERRPLPLVVWLLIGFPFAFTLALSFSPKSNDRYFLPAAAAFTLLAALGIVDAGRLIVRWVPFRWALAGIAAVLVASETPDWIAYENAFLRDDNAELLQWVRTQLPAGAVIAKDSRVELPDPGNPKDQARFGPIPQKVRAERFAADVGSIEQMRALGVTHAAVSESDYGKFFLRSLRPQKDEAEDFARRKDFYVNLLRDGELLFERERGTVLYLHPGIRLYRLPPEGN